MQKTVYVADQLKKHGFSKPVYEKIRFHLGDEKYGYHIKELENVNKNIWCRDYMPVRNCKGHLIKFDYSPSYLMASKSGIKSRPQTNVLKSQIDDNVTDSNIIIDGGSVEIYGESVIVSDRIFRDNFKKWDNDEKGLLKQLKEDLEALKVIVVPQHPYDFTGHVDGMVRFINENNVLINDLSDEFNKAAFDKNKYRKKLIEQWYYSFKMALFDAGLEWKELTSNFFPKDVKIGPSDAYGIYLNFLHLEEIILAPGFGIDEDETARKLLQKTFNKKVVTIQARELARKGGIVNCVTWQL